jgi:hypothetical protein
MTLDLLLSAIRRVVGIFLPDGARVVLLGVVVCLTEVLRAGPELEKMTQKCSTNHARDD